MKITVEKKEKAEELKFPCLMIGEEGEIILAISGNTDGLIAIAIDHPGCSISSGASDEWDFYYFKPFNGKITLENS